MNVSWKPPVFAALAAIIVTAGVLYVRDAQRAKEAEALRRAIAMLDVRPSADSGIRAEGVQEEASPVANRGGEVPPPGASAAVPDGAYRDAGRATPKAAFHTLAWLCDRGEAAVLADALVFEPTVQEWIESYFAQSSAETRAQWSTPAKMAAALYVSATMMRPFPAAAILDLAEEEEIAPGRIKIRLPGTGKDGLQFQQAPDGWRFVITDEMLRGFLGQTPPAPSGK